MPRRCSCGCTRSRPLATFLVTSRIVLRIRGEQRLRGRAPLPTPEPGGARRALDRARQSAAVRAVRRPRAARSKPGFALTDDNAGGRRRHLPAPRGPAPRDRARRREGAPADARRRSPQRLEQQPAAADRGRPRPARAAPHDARDDRLEREPAARGAPRSARGPRRVRDAVHPRGRRGDRRRAGRGTGTAIDGLAALVDGSLVKQTEIDGRVGVLAARDRARVRARPAQGARRGRPRARGARRLLPALVRATSPPTCAAPGQAGRVAAARPGAAEPPRRGAAPRLHRPPRRRRRLRVEPAHLLVDRRASSARCGCGCSSCSARSSRSRRTPARSRGSSRCGARCGSGRLRRSSPASAECVRLFTESGDEDAAAMALAARATARVQLPDPDIDTAARELDDAVERLHRLGNGWGEAITEVSLGRVAWLRGSPRRRARALRPGERGRRRGRRPLHALGRRQPDRPAAAGGRPGRRSGGGVPADAGATR